MRHLKTLPSDRPIRLVPSGSRLRFTTVLAAFPAGWEHGKPWRSGAHLGEAALNTEGAPGREGEGVFGTRLHQSTSETGQWEVHSPSKVLPGVSLGAATGRGAPAGECGPRLRGTQPVRPGPVPGSAAVASPSRLLQLRRQLSENITEAPTRRDVPSPQLYWFC